MRSVVAILARGLVTADLPYVGGGFAAPYTHLNNASTIRVSPGDLVRMAINYGHPWDPRAPITPVRRLMTLNEIVHRGTLIGTYLRTPRVGPRQRWRASDAYLEGIESTEKGGVSYYLGMAVAALFADKLLKAPIVVHSSMYAKYLGIRFGPAPNRTRARQPDLLALNRRHDVFVLEAKGRSGDSAALRKATFADATDQKRAPVKTGSIAPLVRVASALFIGSDGSLAVEWRDPPTDSWAGGEHIDPVPLAHAHYARLLGVLASDTRARRSIGGRDFTVINIPEIDVQLGLDSRVLDALESDRQPLVWESVIGMPAASSDDVHSIGGDGSVVILGPTWSASSIVMFGPSSAAGLAG